MLAEAAAVRGIAQRDGFDARRPRFALLALTGVFVALAVLFMTYDLKGSLSYALEFRARKLGGLALVGFAVAYSSVLFHTVTHNRILTPSLMGFDALYQLIQTSAAFFFGTFAVLQLDERIRFGIEIAIMLAFATVLYRTLFGRDDRDLYVLVLVGIVMGLMFSSLTSLVSRLIDPNEFIALQDRLFADFSRINQDLLVVSSAIILAVVAVSWRLLPRLDVVALGREHSTNLGVDHQRIVNEVLVVIALLVSVSTALVGPVTFLGLLVANLSYQVTGTFRHRYTVPAAVLLGMSALIGGQFILQEVLASSTRLSVVVSFVGGLYFIALLWREARTARA
ncbi:MAG: iron chelate uptake ABC transporter family permease subunit [Dehalococcoidia bacterium]|nr:iron chelate uptake ABC transporter family permease subunit [Dehalococcoidia bacterium]